MDQKEFIVEATNDPRQVPKRVALVKPEISAAVKSEAAEDDLVMAYPHLIVREIIAFEILVIVLALISLFFDAPLEWIANPEHTPSPAKAPWYFLGLQELLHYFPPVVAGVLIPTLVMIALIIIPYTEINIKREGLWKADRHRTFLLVTIAVALIVGILLPFHAYPIAIPTLVIYGVTLIPLFSKRETGLIGRLSRRSLADWIMTWFVVVAVTLTSIGVFFRGPGWKWSWPWVEGIY
ncbi:MAG: hypothetical protein HY709_09010 [Candidatus Latescibacteria bacterium]|nr:hypothetical protein [Candidatus Latescibacterota bacterium]